MLCSAPTVRSSSNWLDCLPSTRGIPTSDAEDLDHVVALWYTLIVVERRQASSKNGIRSYQIFSPTVPFITELWTLIPMVVSAINILTLAFQTIDRKTVIEPAVPKNENLKRIKGTVEFRNFKFIYPTRPEVIVLRNFTLRIEAGLKVALVGPSGMAKSSIFVLRYYDPIGGKILIDGRYVREYNLRRLRAQIGVVQQERLLCGNDSAVEAEVTEVARQVNIHKFIRGLPDEYEIGIDEKDCQLF